MRLKLDPALKGRILEVFTNTPADYTAEDMADSLHMGELELSRLAVEKAMSVLAFEGVLVTRTSMACDTFYSLKPKVYDTPDLKRLLELEAEGIKHCEQSGQEWDYSTVLRWMQDNHNVSWQHAEVTLGAHYDNLTTEPKEA